MNNLYHMYHLDFRTFFKLLFILMLSKLQQKLLMTDTQIRKSTPSTAHHTKRKKFITTQWDAQQPFANLAYASIPLQKQTPHWNQSSSTWRTASHKYSIPRSQRFKSARCSHSDIIQPQIPTSLNNKYTTFGKGKKRPISVNILRRAKQTPSPDSYSHHSFDQQTRSKSRGKTIPQSREKYEKVYKTHRKDVYSPHFTINYPDVNSYTITQQAGSHVQKCAMHKRLKMFTQRMALSKSHVPGPYHDIKEKHLSLMIGLNERSFGMGNKMDLSKPLNNNPGPKYGIPDFCQLISRRNKNKKSTM